MKKNTIEAITPESAVSLSGLFFNRVKATPDKTAYHYYDTKANNWKKLSWIETQHEVLKWQSILQSFAVEAGDKIALLVNNCPQWVFAEQAGFSLGAVIVPLYTNDRADNIAYILDNADIKILIIKNKQQLKLLDTIHYQLARLKAIIYIEEADNSFTEDHKAVEGLDNSSAEGSTKNNVSNPLSKEAPLPVYYYRDRMNLKAHVYYRYHSEPDDLATIVYTSGTTGKPKGVMLSHANILFDTWASICAVPCRSDDKFLSFLPLSHMFERTAGYYIPMMSGAEIAYARSIDLLAADLQLIKPTVIVTVPRIFERVHQKIMAQLEKKPFLAQKLFKLTVNIGWKRFLFYQHKHPWFPGLLLWPLLNKIIAQKVMNKLGGNLRLAISGGAALANDIAQFFIGLGLTITQGYGMTEAAPVISTNSLNNNDPFSVGQILPGIETKFTRKGELLVKAATIMKGYWKNEQATKKVLDTEHWLHTGDKAEIRDNHLYITGRVKEILVLSNGEKVPPGDLETAICSDPAFEQAIVIGESRPFLSAIIVLNEDMWPELADAAHINSRAKNVLQNKQLRKVVTGKISRLLASFPGYEQIRRVKLVLQPWTINNGMLTPTMKLKCNTILKNYSQDIGELYSGHV